MILTYHGGNFIKLQSGDTVIAVNPISKNSKLKTSKFGADVALVSLAHEDFNGVEEVTFGSKEPFVARGPGEYEVKEIFIKGFLTKGAGEKVNTVYFINFDGMHIADLGGIATEDLGDAIESFNDLDILIIPIGKDTLSPAHAYKLAMTLESKIIIPLGDEADIKAFVKESASTPETTEKLTIKKKDLDGKQNSIVILSA